MMLRLNEPSLDATDALAVSDVVRSGWIGLDGTQTKRFERDFARRHEMRHGVAVQSGTAATHTALWALFESRRRSGTFRGGHVAVADFTCSAPGAAVVHAGGTPHFVDVEESTLGMSVMALAELDGDGLDVVLVVHVYGAPARDMEQIVAWCREHGVSVLEDCCEAHGAKYPDGSSIGTRGDVAVFSVRSEKVIGVGEGGVVVTNDPELAQLAEFWANRGKPRDGWVWRFYTSEPGCNYKMPHVLGALAWTQLAKMDGFIDRRRRIAAMYRELLPEFWWQTMPPGGSAWLEFVRFPVEPPTDPVELDELGISPKVKRMGDWLFERQIEVRPGFIPLRRHPAFRVPPDGAWTAADDAVWRGLCLPSHPGLDDADVLSVVRAVREAWEVA